MQLPKASPSPSTLFTLPSLWIPWTDSCSKRGWLLWLWITFPCSQAAICPCSWLIPEPILWGMQTLSGIPQPSCCFLGCAPAAWLPAPCIEGVACIFFSLSVFYLTQPLQISVAWCLSSAPFLHFILCQQHQPPYLFHLVPQGISVPSMQPVMLGKKICSSHLHPHLIEISAKNSLLLWNPGKTRGRTGNRNQKRISQPCPCISSSNMRLCLSRSLHDLSVVTFIFPFPSPSVFGPPSPVHAEYKLRSSAETPCFYMYFEQRSIFFSLFF